MVPEDDSSPTYPDLGVYDEEEFEMRVLVINWNKAFLPFIAGEANIDDP